MDEYNLDVNELLNKYTEKEYDVLTEEEKEEIKDRVADELTQLVFDGKIKFPYQKYFMDDPCKLFDNLKNINLPVINVPYKLYSYYPKYCTYLPAKFRGKYSVIEVPKGIYNKADVLSDYFIEDIRLKAKRYDQIHSISECWDIQSCVKEIMKISMKNTHITPKSLRSSIYEATPETKIFNPSWARALIKLVLGNNLKEKKWLDISAGWGDRLLAAMSLDMDYVGFDPNTELKEGHNNMISMFGDTNRHKIIYEPFETALIPEGPYDVILSSPPYFTLEEYVPNQKGQSIVNYPDFNQWMVWFLFNSLNKAWDNLKEEGYLILHIGDTKTIRICEATNIFIEQNLPDSSWEGVIGLQGEAGFARPVWVWKKTKKYKEIWTSEKFYNKNFFDYNNRTLYKTYPELQVHLINFFASNYSQDYIVRKNNAIAIRDHVSVSLPDIDRKDIDILLSDDLMISSLLESIGVDNTINWAILIIKSIFP